MKYVKMLGLLAIAAAALMAFAGTASATLTSPAGTTYGGTIHATAGFTSLDGSVDVTCTSSTITGSVASGSTTVKVTGLSYSGCGKDTVTPISKGNHFFIGPITYFDPWYGSLTISGGKVSSTGAEVTVQLHRTVFGFPITTHCIYKTNNTNIGNFTGGTPAQIDVDSASIPQTATDGACGFDTEWTGSYTVTTPGTLFAD